MKTLRIFDEGEAPFPPVDPDDFRAHVAAKSRQTRSKLVSAAEAVARFVADGDYVVWECNYLQRGPSILIREIVRQRKRNLWLCGKFTWVTVALLAEAGCADRIDAGFFMGSRGLTRLVLEGKVKIFEYSNLVMTQRLRAGAMGVSFLPVRSLGGTDGFRHSGAKLIEDPYTGRPVVVVPALHPDVALIHVHQADEYGNARIFGAGITDVESALASRKVVLVAEEIVSTEEIRHNPGLTRIPYYAVDAVVHAPFGAYPGECMGLYASDTEHVVEVFAALAEDRVQEYLEKWVYAFGSDAEMLERRVGFERLTALRRRATIQEGFRP